MKKEPSKYENALREAPSGGPAAGDKGRAGRLTVTTAIRAATAIIVFGIPLVVGTATVVGCGVYKAYKRLTRS